MNTHLAISLSTRGSSSIFSVFWGPWLKRQISLIAYSHLPCTILLAGDFLCHHLDQLMNICLCIFGYSCTNTHTNTNNFSITREHIFQGQHLLLFSLTLWSPGLKHDRLLCPSLSPRICSNSCPLNWWCYLTISTSATLSSCLQSSPASGSFSVSQLFASGGQSTGALASASVLPKNIQSWFSLGLTGLILLAVQGTLSTTVWKYQFFGSQPSLRSNSHISIWLLEKPWLSLKEIKSLELEARVSRFKSHFGHLLKS